MPIAYDRQATFVSLPFDMAFGHILRGDMPVMTLPRLQPECERWCKTNLRGHYGAQERAKRSINDHLPRDYLDDDFLYFMWFEFFEDATHFKLRWF